MVDQFDFIDQLFGTLEKATDNNSKTLQKLVDQQVSLISTVEKMPINEIKQDIKDHVAAAFNERKSISDKIETKSESILDEVKDLTIKVKLMIGIVSAAVVISGIAYFVARFYFDAKYTKEARLQQEIEQELEHDEIKREVIEAIRKEFRKEFKELRKNNSEVDKVDRLR